MTFWTASMVTNSTRFISLRLHPDVAKLRSASCNRCGTMSRSTVPVNDSRMPYRPPKGVPSGPDDRSLCCSIGTNSVCLLWSILQVWISTNREKDSMKTTLQHTRWLLCSLVLRSENQRELVHTHNLASAPWAVFKRTHACSARAPAEGLQVCGSFDRRGGA